LDAAIGLPTQYSLGECPLRLIAARNTSGRVRRSAIRSRPETQASQRKVPDIARVIRRVRPRTK
jgi:hypothetical protein